MALVLTHRTEHPKRLVNSGHDERWNEEEGVARGDRSARIDPRGHSARDSGDGSYIGEGFGDQRFDTLFPTLPVSWCTTLQQDVVRR